MTVGTVRGRRRGVPAVVIALGFGAVLLTGCSGGRAAIPFTSDPPTQSPSISPSASPSVSPTPTRTPVGSAPLTGLPVYLAAGLIRPIVAVAVGVVPGAAAPVGLGSADVLYQEFDRTGRSRILALYQTFDVRSVGPVADTAPFDVRVLSPMAAPVYAFAGGPTGFVAQALTPAVTARSAVTGPGLFRSAGGLFTSTSALRASAPNALPPPPGLLSFDAVPATAAKGARKVGKVTIAIPGQPVQSWSWTGKLWSGAAGLTRTNLVIQYALYKTLAPSKAAPVGSAEVIGTGASVVLAGNLAVSGTWIRPALQQVTNYTDAAGVPFSFKPGTSLVLFVPAGTKVTLS